MDYLYYTGIYGGRLLRQEDFLRLKGRAVRYVQGLIRPCARRGRHRAVRFAACAVMEAFFLQERQLQRGDIQSETVGKHSVTYSGERAAQGIYAAAARWLEPAGLLYRGI